MPANRTESHLNYLYAAKVIVPVALCVTALITGVYHFSPFLVFCMALVLGYLAPDYWITHKITTSGSSQSSNELSVVAGKSVLVNGQAPIERVSVGIGDVAEVTAVSPREVLVNGKTPGSTTLIIGSRAAVSFSLM